MPTPKYCNGACNGLVIPEAEKVKEKEDLKIMFKWEKIIFFHVIVDREIFRYLKNKK